MTYDELVERVARAMCAKNGWDPDEDLHFVTGDKPRWTLFVDDARAAISVIAEVMREPVQASHDAARDWSRAKYGMPIGIDASDGCWRAMLAASPLYPTDETGKQESRS